MKSANKFLGFFFILVLLLFFGGSLLQKDFVKSITNIVITDLSSFRGDKIPLKDNITSLKSKFETQINENIFWHGNAIQLFGMTQKLIGKRFINNAEADDILKLDNGHVVQAGSYFSSRIQVSKAAVDKILKIKKQADSLNIDMLYMTTPYKISKFDSQIPDGFPLERSNERADNILKVLRESRS